MHTDSKSSDFVSAATLKKYFTQACIGLQGVSSFHCFFDNTLKPCFQKRKLSIEKTLVFWILMYFLWHHLFVCSIWRKLVLYYDGYLVLPYSIFPFFVLSHSLIISSLYVRYTHHIFLLYDDVELQKDWYWLWWYVLFHLGRTKLVPR